ncbi:MAG: L-glyceraldehyde 3-phosphate reductase [Candidatus Heimdallarchaeota archaeon LC_2]|nr:MAG: L-glyceraldehyde 3-phosphate reductase [Candidatus Heimdallarchaeota archaeon LC_2]
MGKHGIRLSEVSLGAWLTYGSSVEDTNAIKIMHEALELGVNFIDVADIYAKGQAELVVGKALEGDIYSRKDLVISSKVFWPMTDNPNDVGLSRKHIGDSIENSLKRFKLDYLDIYFCHRFDWQTPLEETVGIMDDLVHDGKIKYWGTSVWSAPQLERVVGVCKEMGATFPTVEQPRYNIMDRYIELEVMNTTKYHGMGIVPWSPLHGGLLSGKYNDGIPEGSRGAVGGTKGFIERYLTDDNIAKLKKLSELAKELDISTSQLALAWILRKDEISSVITGATKIDHIQDNVKAVEVNLCNDTLERIEEIFQNKPEWHAVYAPMMVDR